MVEWLASAGASSTVRRPGASGSRAPAAICNLPPERLAAGGLGVFERRLTGLLRTGQIEALGARLPAIGALSTLGADHLTRDRLSSPSRYALLASRMRAERRRPVAVHIADPETLRFSTDSIAPEAAAASLQLHLQVPPERFTTTSPSATTAAPTTAAGRVTAGNAPGHQSKKAF
jgi:hypothetical protein